jgi:hypothetical protein
VARGDAGMMLLSRRALLLSRAVESLAKADEEGVANRGQQGPAPLESVSRLASGRTLAPRSSGKDGPGNVNDRRDSRERPAPVSREAR